MLRVTDELVPIRPVGLHGPQILMVDHGGNLWRHVDDGGPGHDHRPDASVCIIQRHLPAAVRLTPEEAGGRGPDETGCWRWHSSRWRNLRRGRVTTAAATAHENEGKKQYEESSWNQTA